MSERDVDREQKERLDSASKKLREMQEVYMPFVKPRIIISSNTSGLWHNNSTEILSNNKECNISKTK